MPAIAAGADNVPCLAEQAAAKGWAAGIFNFGLAEAPNVDYFNPGLVQRPDGLWLMTRRAVWEPGVRWGQNKIVAFKLGEDRTPQFGKVLKFVGAAPNEQFEDPRAIYHNGRTWVGACNFIFYGERWTGAHQTLGVFLDDWECLLRYHPEVGGNGCSLRANTKHEKNWPWFFHEERLHLLYQANPWTVVSFGTKWDEQTKHNGREVTWNYGEIRGGTPPVRVDDLYWTFFHSSMPWQGPYRRYYMGALAFQATPPFTPVFITPEPMLIGSPHDRWNQRKPPCVFPCGAVLQNGSWFITYGVNDLNCGWVEIPHKSVASQTISLDKLVSCVKVPSSRKRNIRRRKNHASVPLSPG